MSATTTSSAGTLTWREALADIEAARTPADLFALTDAAADKRRYRTLARVVHPDALAGEGVDDADLVARAGEAFAKLTRLFTSRTAPSGAAGRGRTAGTPNAPVEFRTRRSVIVLGDRRGTDELAVTYAATHTPMSDAAATTPALVLIPRAVADNDLLATEATTLRLLGEKVDAQYAAYFPTLLDAFVHTETNTGIQRRINVTSPLDGFVSLAQVHDAYPTGLDPRDAAWMWRRLLVALGALHRTGRVHGAVSPERVWIHPEAHGLVLGDYAYAVETGTPAVALPPSAAAFAPAEVADRKPLTAATDIAAASKVMAHLMGPRLSEPLRAFVNGTTLTSPTARPDDAWALLGELDDLLERMWGPRRFRPFSMPKTST